MTEIIIEEVAISKGDLKLVIEYIEESEKLLYENGYRPKDCAERLLNRLKLRLGDDGND